MKRAEQASKLECGLQAYADSVEAGGTLTGFRQRLGSWPIYAAAAGSALALSTSAMASTIIVSGLVPRNARSISITSHGKFSLSLHYSITNGSRGYGRASLNGQGIATTGAGHVSAFPNGTKAFDATGFHGNGKHLLRFDTFSRHSGLWPASNTAYAAIKLANGDQGWIQIDLGGGGTGEITQRVEILAYAYEEISGPPPSTVPEPSSLALALLATGSVGVLAYRRRRKAAASQRAAT